MWKRRGSPPYTWRTIIGVLRTVGVAEVRLSEELTSWITQGHGLASLISQLNKVPLWIVCGFYFFVFLNKCDRTIPNGALS